LNTCVELKAMLCTKKCVRTTWTLWLLEVVRRQEC